MLLPVKLLAITKEPDVLTRPEDVIRDAFDGIVHQVRVEAGREVWLGKVG